METHETRDVLEIDGVPLDEIAIEFGTPCYVYSASRLDEACRQFKQAFESHPTTLCYAVKANGNLTLLRRIFSHGFGADVVSQGELDRALTAGAPAKNIVFSGVGKTEQEIVHALNVGVRALHVESLEELALVALIARELKQRAQISLRINPNVDAHTLPQIATGLYETKFGIAESDLDECLSLVQGNPAVALIGIGCHIGSQILTLEPFSLAAQRMASLAVDLKKKGFPLLWVDLGGGLGIRYQPGETEPSLLEYAATIQKALAPTGLELILEPGRRITGHCGGLLTRVLREKHTPKRRFVIVDAAMNDLIRPCLYGAYHEMTPVIHSKAEPTPADIVGPICETTDCFAENRPLPPMKSHDLLWIETAGAYGFSMASRYNSRVEPAEVLVEKGVAQVIRRRAKLSDCWALEVEPS